MSLGLRMTMKTTSFTPKTSIFALCVAGAFALMALQACSSESGTGGSGAGAGSGGAGGAPVDCMPTLPASPPACPDTPTAEAAWTAAQSACGLSDTDVDASNPQSPSLTANGKAKICTTCECQQKAFDYHALYINCTDSQEAANTAFAKNVYDVAAACGL